MRRINVFLLISLVIRFCGAVEEETNAHSFDIPHTDKSKWRRPNDLPVRSTASMHGSRLDDDASACLSDSKAVELRSALSSCHQELDEMKLNPIKTPPDSTSPALATFSSSVCKCPTDPTLLKHVVRPILIRLNLETKVNERRKLNFTYQATLQFSLSEVRTLQRFLDTDVPDMNLIQDARLAMETFIKKVHIIQAMDEEPTFWETIWTILTYCLQIGNAIFMPLAAALVLQHILYNISLIRFGISLYIIIFCVSCGWTWSRLVREEQAERNARFKMFGVPKDCCPEEQGAFKDIEVDSNWKVSPVEAGSLTFAMMVTGPLQIIGENLAKFFNALYMGLPLLLSPLVIGLLFGFLLFVVLLLRDYRIRLPFFLGVIEPAQRGVIHQPETVNSAAQQQIPSTSVPKANAPLSQVHSLSAHRDRSPAGGSLQDRVRQGLRESQHINAGQLRRRDFHRSVSLPRVSDADW
uniref:Chloride channel CLIC-like protein 1 n=1 Tax=Plectus sambesii TaxID=2011161 RepID=A0A914X1W1_9BILA